MPTGVYARKHPEERLLEKIAVGDGCWKWSGFCDPDGYGQFRYQGRTIGAHCASYLLLVGDYDRALNIDHLCRNPSCVRPSHLEPVPSAVNTERGVLKKVLAAKAATRTHCKRGHPWIAENIIENRKGELCRICWRERAAEWRKRNRERVNELQRRRRAAGRK